MSKKYDSLVNNNLINFIWLIIIIASVSFGILGFAIFILAVTDVQILSWSIGYIIMSTTNDVIITPSIVVTIICTVIFILCMLKNRIIKRIVKE